jgi:hypothetical protein
VRPHLKVGSRVAGLTHARIHVWLVKFCGFCLPRWVPRTKNGKVMENIGTTPGNSNTSTMGHVPSYGPSSWSRVRGGWVDPPRSEHVRMVKFGGNASLGGFLILKQETHAKRHDDPGNRKTCAMGHARTYESSTWSRVGVARLTMVGYMLGQ